MAAGRRRRSSRRTAHWRADRPTLIVLLTNRSGVLPLADTPRRLAVLGPLADARAEMLGPWAAAGQAADTVSLLEGLGAALPASEIMHAGGVPIDGEDVSGIPAALDLARAADVVVLCLGEAAAMSGEAAAAPDRTCLAARPSSQRRRSTSASPQSCC